MSLIRTPIYSSKDDTGINARADEPDDYKTKLVKYIPGEVIIIFTPLVALATKVSSDVNTQNIAIWATGFLGLIATLGYFWIRSRKLPANERPAWFFYLLSLPAFFIWAIVVSEPARDSLNITNGWAEFLLGFGAFAIPFLDEVFTALKEKITISR